VSILLPATWRGVVKYSAGTGGLTLMLFKTGDTTKKMINPQVNNTANSAIASIFLRRRIHSLNPAGH
jgi:hypothetical protein